MYFGGVGNVVAMKVVGLVGFAGSFASFVVIMFFFVVFLYINFLMVFVGVFKIGDEIFWFYCGVFYVVVAIGIWYFGSVGVIDIWMCYWIVWYFVFGVYLLIVMNKICNVFGFFMCDGICKVVIVGLVMFMVAFIC